MTSDRQTDGWTGGKSEATYMLLQFFFKNRALAKLFNKHSVLTSSKNLVIHIKKPAN